MSPTANVWRWIGVLIVLAACFFAGTRYERNSRIVVSSDTSHAIGIGRTETGTAPAIVNAPAFIELKDDTIRVQRSIARKLRQRLDSLISAAFPQPIGGDVAIESPTGDVVHDIIAKMDTGLTRTVCLPWLNGEDTCLSTRDSVHVEYSLPFERFSLSMLYGYTPILRDTVRIRVVEQSIAWGGLSFDRIQWFAYGGGALYAADRLGIGEPAGQALAIGAAALIIKGLLFPSFP